MNIHTELEEKLNKIREVFNVDEILNLDINKKHIQQYYKVNKLPYSLFHTRTGLIHMGLTYGDKFKQEDLLGQAKIVEKYLKKVQAKRVLELATGRGGVFYLPC